jgi:hypothetical protein
MYRRPIFLEALLKIRQEMAREADYDVDLFAEMVRGGKFSSEYKKYDLSEADKMEEKPIKVKPLKLEQ